MIRSCAWSCHDGISAIIGREWSQCAFPSALYPVSSQQEDVCLSRKTVLQNSTMLVDFQPSEL